MVISKNSRPAVQQTPAVPVAYPSNRPSLTETPTANGVRPLLTRKEAAEWLRISERTLFTITRRDGIPVVQIGAKVLYNADDLDRWIREHTTTSQDQ